MARTIAISSLVRGDTTTVPDQHNVHSICKPIEIAYLHADSSAYGLRVVLNGISAFQAPGFWYDNDRK
jgi:hypothetical protein